MDSVKSATRGGDVYFYPLHSPPRVRRNDAQVDAKDVARVPAKLPRNGQSEQRVICRRRKFEQNTQYLRTTSVRNDRGCAVSPFEIANVLKKLQSEMQAIDK